MKIHNVCSFLLITFVVSVTTIASVAPVMFMPPMRMNSIDLDRFEGSITVHAAARGNPWINFRDGRNLAAVYKGAAGLPRALEYGRVQPTALASGDFDEDGVADLISGYVSPSGGIITVYRGNVDSIYPNSAEARQRRAADR